MSGACSSTFPYTHSDLAAVLPTPWLAMSQPFGLGIVGVLGGWQTDTTVAAPPHPLNRPSEPSQPPPSPQAPSTTPNAVREAHRRQDTPFPAAALVSQ
jgi:hypothetical protein